MEQGYWGLDYYGRMFTPLRTLLALALIAVALGSTAQSANPADDTPNNSILNRDLFYELLVGEISAQSGDGPAAYALILDAARKSNSPQLYQRAVEIALAARSGPSALDAARAWNTAFPASQDANRYLLQVLLGLNRIADIKEPLKRHLALLPPPERIAAMSQLPRHFARVSDKKLVALTMEQALASELTNPISGPAAWSTLGLIRLQAGDTAGALEASRHASTLNARAEEPVYLALSAMDPKVPDAEALVLKYLSGQASPEIRITYVRNLLEVQRFSDAYTQVQLLTKASPQFADGWLVRGSLEFQMQKMALAEVSLTSYLALNVPSANTEAPQETGRGMVQALLLLSQIAEQSQRLEEAENYLKRIDSPKDSLRVAVRRASLLARQGKLDEGRAIIRNAPETQESDERTKTSAEVQLLRENRQFQTAYDVLVDAIARYPQDNDLVYDQAMMAERLGKANEMEQLLRRLIASKPDYHHAYNALGFSLAERNVRLPEARQLVVKALELAPNDPFIVDSLAWVEFRSGNSAEALRLLQDAYKTRPDAEIAAHLGEVLWTQGKRDEALDMWKQGAALNPDNETLLETTLRLQAKP
jgi:tetratricopeptide (TPR) repeat protein